MAGEVLAKMINDAKPKEQDFANLMYGRVLAINPLKIEIERVEGSFTISNNQIMLSQMVQDFSISINVPAVTITTDHINNVALDGTRPDVDADVSSIEVITGINTSFQSQEIQIFRALQIDDRVKVLRCGKGQKFYVLERG